MTVTANSYTPLTYNGNGSTTVFSVTYQFYDLLVTHIDSSGSETVWVENTDFTVTGGAGSTGSITATTAPASGEQIRIERDTDKAQGEDYDLDNEVLEASLQSSVDKIAMIMQELTYNNNRRPAISIANYTSPVEFPAASTGSVLSWAADGNLANTALVDLDGVAISALTTTASLENTDIFPIYDDSAGDNAGITWANIKAGLGDLAIKDTVDADDIDNDAITTAKILDSNVTTDKMADNDVTLAKMEHGTAGDILYYGASGAPTRLAKGSEGQILMQGGSYPEWGSFPLFHIQDQKSSGTDGGTFTSGSYQTRDLNTSVFNNISGALLSSNQITLPAGTYEVIAFAVAYDCNSHQARLRNVTDSTTLCIGLTMYANASNNVGNAAKVTGIFTLAATKVIELQHQCGSTKSSTGFGTPASFGTEVYSDIQIRKVA